MTGGFTLWKDRGYEVEVPRTFTRRAARALLAPLPAARGRRRGPAEAARRQGAAARRRRPRLADRALPRRRRRRHARHRRRRRRRPLEPPAPGHPHDRPRRRAEGRLAPSRRSTRSTPTSNVVKYQTRLDASNIMEIIEGYDVIVDGVDNFPTRYLLNDASVRLQIPVVSASILGFDGQLVGLRAVRRPVLPLPLPGAAAGRARAVLRRQRRPRRAARARWACCRRPRSSSSSSARASRSSAACCSTRRSSATFTELKVRRDPECPICSRDPDDDHRRGDGRLPRLRGVLRRRRLALPRSAMATITIPPVLRPSVGGEQEVDADGAQRRRGPRRRSPTQHPDDAGAALRRRRRAQPLRQRLPQRRGRPRPRRPRRRAVGEGDTLVILPAMAGGA